MNKVTIKAYKWDKPYNPKSCRECDLFFRCGTCVPCDSAKVDEYWDRNEKPEWCPVGGEQG